MTSLMKPATPKRGAVKLGGEARVDLMPPEIKARAKQRGQMRGVGMLVVVAVVVVAAATGGAWFLRTQAEAALVDAQNRTLELQTQLTQYSEVQQVAQSISNTQSAMGEVASTEVLWLGVYEQFFGVLPADGSITSVTFTGTLPWEQATDAGAALFQTGTTAATVQLTVEAGSLNDTAAFLRSLQGLDIVAGASLNSVAVTDGVATGQISVTLSEAALSGRIGEQFSGGEATTDAAAVDAETPAGEEVAG